MRFTDLSHHDSVLQSILTHNFVLGVAFQLLAVLALTEFVVSYFIHYALLDVRIIRETFFSMLVPGLLVVSFWII